MPHPHQRDHGGGDGPSGQVQALAERVPERGGAHGGEGQHPGGDEGGDPRGLLQADEPCLPGQRRRLAQQRRGPGEPRRGEHEREQAQGRAAQAPHRQRGEQHGRGEGEQPALPALHGEGADRGEDPDQAQRQRVQRVGRDPAGRGRGDRVRCRGGQVVARVGRGDEELVVARGEHRRAAGPRLAQQLQHLTAPPGVQAHGRLVQHEQVGALGEGRDDRETALFAAGEAVGVGAGERGEARPLKELVREVLVRGPGGGEDLLPHGRRDEGVLGVLGDEGDLGGLGAGHGARARLRRADEDAQEGGLARTGRAGQRGQPPSAQLEVLRCGESPGGHGDAAQRGDGLAGPDRARCLLGGGLLLEHSRLDQHLATVGEELVRTPVGEHPGAGAEHDQPVHVRQPGTDPVLGDDEGAAARDREDRPAHLLGRRGIEHGGRLVQEQQVGAQGQRAGQRDPLLLAARGVQRRPLGVEVDSRCLERPGGALGELRPGQSRVLRSEGGVAGDGRADEGVHRVLQQQAPLPGPAGRGDEPLAVPVLGVQQPGQRPQHRGLPAAARPGQQHSLPGRDREVEPLDGRLAPAERPPAQPVDVHGRGRDGPGAQASTARAASRPEARESTAPVATSARLAAQPRPPASTAPESRKKASIVPENSQLISW